MGIVVVAAFRRQCRRRATSRDDHGHLTTNQFGRQSGQSIVVALCPAIFDRHVAAFNITGFAKPLLERAHTLRSQARPFGAQESYYRHRRLLRPRGERPRRGHAAEQRDELASIYLRLHSITSSARARIPGHSPLSGRYD